MIAYACTTTTCTERFRGFCDEPLHCSVCWEDLTALEVPDGSDLETLADTFPRPMPEIAE